MKDPGRIWVIDDEHSVRWVLEKAFTREQLRCVTFDNAAAAIRQLEQEHPALVISDVCMADTDGIDLLKRFKEKLPALPVILMTAYTGIEDAVSAFDAGALEFVPKPFDLEQLITLVRHTLGGTDVKPDAPDPSPVLATHELRGDSPVMHKLYRDIARLARADIGVLINGESGTGKELVARALHRHSRRGDAPFIAINTAAIPRELLGSELFGHERGAFTGATTERRGRFEQADQGTLFLDEIGDLPLELQAPLLRVLAEGEFYRVGGSAPVHVNVRMIAASHHDLEARVQRGHFRADLYYRLNVASLCVPPLRARGGDLVLLATHFLQEAARRNQTAPCILPPRTLERLATCTWPGNVRQLENFCQWAAVMCAGRELHPEELPQGLGLTTNDRTDDHWTRGLRLWAEQALTTGHSGLLAVATAQVEKVLLQAALEHTDGNRKHAARLIGMGRNTLARKAETLGLTAPLERKGGTRAPRKPQP